MGLFRSPDNGKSWDYIDVGFPYPSINKIIVDPLDSNIIYIAMSFWGVYKSQNKGVTWKPVNAGLGSEIHFADMAVDPMNPETLYLVQYDGSVYKTTNGGLFWNKLTAGWPAQSDCKRFSPSQIDVDPGNPSSLYVLDRSCGIYKSTDRGEYWERIFYRGNGSIVTLFIDPGTSSIYVAVVDNSNSDVIFKTDNGGTSWHISHYGLPDIKTPFFLITDPATATTLYLGSGEGIFKNENSGEWMSMGKLSTFVFNLSISPSTPPVLHAGTSSGVYSLPLAR
jgi:photosystem II stability/assembly factor-like uncharacterized protein